MQREEALTERLRVMADDKRIGGYRAISDWLPSPARQQADAALTAKVEPGVLSAVSEAVGEPLQRPQFAAAPLTALIASYSSPEGLFWAKLSAVSTLACAPILIFGWISQKQLVRGLSFGAVK